VVADLREPLALDAVESAPLRGLAYQLEQGLGTIDKQAATAQLAALAPAERERLSALGVRIGQRTVYAAPLLMPRRLAARAALCRALIGAEAADALPSVEQLVSARSPRLRDRTYSLLVGFVALPSWLLRCDVLERLLACAPAEVLDEARLMLGMSQEQTEAIVRELPRKRRRRRKRA